MPLVYNGFNEGNHHPCSQGLFFFHSTILTSYALLNIDMHFLQQHDCTLCMYSLFSEFLANDTVMYLCICLRGEIILNGRWKNNSNLHFWAINLLCGGVILFILQTMKRKSVNYSILLKKTRYTQLSSHNQLLIDLGWTCDALNSIKIL